MSASNSLFINFFIVIILGGPSPIYASRFVAVRLFIADCNAGHAKSSI